METLSSPLSSYVHYILLCYLPSMKCQPCVALLMRALTAFAVHLPTNTTTPQQHAVDAAKGAFYTLGQQCSIMIALIAVWDSYSGFFFLVS